MQVNIILCTLAIDTCAKILLPSGHPKLKFLINYILNFEKISHILEIYLSILGSSIAFFLLVLSLNEMLNLHHFIYCLVVYYLHGTSFNLLVFLEYFIELFHQPILYMPLLKMYHHHILSHCFCLLYLVNLRP